MTACYLLHLTSFVLYGTTAYQYQVLEAILMGEKLARGKLPGCDKAPMNDE